MPKIVDHDERRAEVLAAVWRVIERAGIEHATVRSIAKEAGYSAGILGHYFEDKEDILTSALRLSHQRTRERWARKLASLSGIEALRELIYDNLPLDEERVLETRLEISYWARSLSNADVLAVKRKESEELYGRVQSLVAEAQERGEIHADVVVEEATERLMALVDGLSLHAVLYPDLVPVARQLACIDQEFAVLSV